MFEETAVGELSDFVSIYGLSLVRKDHYFTFSTLQDAPDFSIKGADLLGVTATKTFSGSPWEVFEQNGVVYDFENDELIPISSVTDQISLDQLGSYLVSPGLILPGSLTDRGMRVKDYAAWFSVGLGYLKYSEVQFV